MYIEYVHESPVTSGMGDTLCHDQLNASLRFTERLEASRARKKERKLKRGGGGGGYKRHIPPILHHGSALTISCLQVLNAHLY